MSEPRYLDAEDLEREEIEGAKLMSVEEKLALGPLLFREAIAFTEAMLRSQFPHADADQINAMLLERLRSTSVDEDSD